MMEVLIISIMSVSFQALLSSLFRCVACPDLMGLLSQETGTDGLYLWSSRSTQTWHA
jgi:hypothetical protein